MRLLAASKLVNQAVGDAFSGLLLAEAILQNLSWSINQWNELYQDLPSRQLKVGFSDQILCNVWQLAPLCFPLSLFTTHRIIDVMALLR